MLNFALGFSFGFVVALASLYALCEFYIDKR